MGKYYSDSDSHPDAFTDTDSFATANVDILAVAFWFAGGITGSNVRVSDHEPNSGAVNTSAARAKRVLLMSRMLSGLHSQD